MAADFITLNRTASTAPFVNELVSIPADVRRLIDKLEQVREKGFRMFVPAGENNDPPADFAVFEAKYGIPAGSGQTVFDLVNGTLMALKGESMNGNATELMNRVG